MLSISGVSTSAVRPAAARTEEVSRVRGTGEEKRAPVRDEYVPEEKREPTGRYWPGRDEESRPRIFFDDPERAAPDGAGEPPDAAAPAGDRKAAGPEKKEEERCTGDTGKVDREIQRLKRRQRELEQRLGTETDERKIEKLERELAQVERELRQKDNDAYRRQHMTVS